MSTMIENKAEAKRRIKYILARYYEKSSYSYKTLSKDAGISYSYLCKIMRGKIVPSAEYICRIAYRLNIDIKYLLKDLERWVVPSGLRGQDHKASHYLDIYYETIGNLFLKEMQVREVKSKPESDKIIVDRINYLICKKECNYEDFALEIGYSEAYIKLIASGKYTPSIKVMDKIAQHCNIDIESLLSGLEKYLGPKAIRVKGERNTKSLSRYYRSIKYYLALENNPEYIKINLPQERNRKIIYSKPTIEVHNIYPGTKILVHVKGETTPQLMIMDRLESDNLIARIFGLNGAIKQKEIPIVNIDRVYETEIISNDF